MNRADIDEDAMTQKKYFHFLCVIASFGVSCAKLHYRASYACKKIKFCLYNLQNNIYFAYVLILTIAWEWL